DHAFALPATGLTGERCDPDQAGDLTSGETPELGQLGQQAARGLIGDAGHRGEEIFGLAPSRRATDQLADIVGKLLQLTLQDLDVAGQTLADTHIAGALLALALGDQHLDDLTPPRDQLTEQPRRLIGDRPRFGLYRFG